MLKTAKHYLPNLIFMKGLTIEQKPFLQLVISLGGDNETVFIDTLTFSSILGISERRVKKIRTDLKKDNILTLHHNSKHGRQHYKINLQKLEDLITIWNEKEKSSLHATPSSRSNKSSPLERKDETDKDGRSNESLPLNPSRSNDSSPHNEISSLTRYNVKKSVGFRSIKVFENRSQQLTEKLTWMKANELIKGEAANRSIPDIVADLIFHIDNRPDSLTEVGSANGALNLLHAGTWSRPKGLREQLEAKAIERERLAHLAKQQEWADMKSHKNIAVPEIQRMLAGLATYG